MIEPNELVALDTDVVGCFGYYADFSRTFSLDDADLVFVGWVAHQLRVNAVRLIGAGDERAAMLVESGAGDHLDVITRRG